MLHIFPITDNGEITFIWASEETGYRHLYLITSVIPRPGVISNGFSNPFDTSDCDSSDNYDSNDSKHRARFVALHYLIFSPNR